MWLFQTTSEKLGAINCDSSIEYITFCIQCRNRLYQLKQTLPENLRLLKQYPNIGIALLNYNSDDGLDEWARDNLRTAISSGKLLYAREMRSKVFHASKAKNLAHRLARGMFLINLDADNFIGKSIEPVIKILDEDHNLVLQTWSGNLHDGTFGRIGLSRKDFYGLGGYDESLLPVGYQDIDLIHRAQWLGLKFVEVLCDTRALRNQKSQSMKYVGTSARRMTYAEMNARNMARSWKNLIAGRLAANAEGWGRAVLEVNFVSEAVFR